MHIGLLAPEFPPMLGGMAELARGLAEQLATSDRLSLFCLPGCGIEGPWRLAGQLTGRTARDAALLRGEERSAAPPDLWLAMNAGLVPLARRLDRPLFAYLHGNDFTNPWLACGPALLEAMRRPYASRIRHPLRRRAIARALPGVRHVFTNSHQTAALIRRRLQQPSERLSVVHPGVGDVFFQDRDVADAAADRPLEILTVTRLSSHTRRKNVDGVLRAVARLEADHQDIHYTVVGDGDDRPRLEALARELGIEARVTFAGKVELDDLLAAYRRADLFILASKATADDVEGFGIVYIEASASGVPAMCSRAGGATDAVVDGVNGLLIDDSSPAAIAAGIERFGNERRRFAPSAVRAFAEEFRWPKIAAQLRAGLLEHLAEPA